jgi:hypothetical protein
LTASEKAFNTREKPFNRKGRKESAQSARRNAFSWRTLRARCELCG